jgi:DNA-binding LacI/PurR family transcriptional regulator
MNKFVDDLKSGKPGLIVGAQSVCNKLAHYDVDNVQIAKCAVEHLAKLGHQRIGFVGGAYKISNSRDRWQGFTDACKAHEVPVCEAYFVKGSSWRLSSEDLETLTTILTRPDRPTAIFAAGYAYALDLYDVAAKIGLKIPHDLSVVAVDDPPGSAHLNPPITTVRQPLVDMGRAALTSLSHHMNNGSPQMDRRHFVAELVVRKSTAPPAE